MRNRLLIAMAALAVVSAASYPVLAQGRSFYTESGTMESGLEPGAMTPPAGEPQRWVRVGYDFNDDGVIDRFEYLNVQDLERARRRSMERREAVRTSPGEFRSEFQRDRSAGAMREAARAFPAMNTVVGTITDMREIPLVGMDQRQLIGKLKTPEGIAWVDLGPVGSLGSLNLRAGDQVTVHGTPGTINNKEMLMAHRIEAGGRILMVGWPNDLDLSRYSGEVLSVRTAAFSDPKVPEQVFARVLLDQGGVTTVNLGPSHELKNTAPGDLRGKHISFLAHPAKIGDRVALVAEELRVDGRTVHVDWSMAAPRT